MSQALATRLSRELQGCLKKTISWGRRLPTSGEGRSKLDPLKRYRFGIALVCFRPLGHEGRCRRKRFGVLKEIRDIR